MTNWLTLTYSFHASSYIHVQGCRHTGSGKPRAALWYSLACTYTLAETDQDEGTQIESCLIAHAHLSSREPYCWETAHMYVYMCVCMYVCMYVCEWVCVCVRTYIYECIWMHMSKYAYYRLPVYVPAQCGIAHLAMAQPFLRTSVPGFANLTLRRYSYYYYYFCYYYRLKLDRS